MRIPFFSKRVKIEEEDPEDNEGLEELESGSRYINFPFNPKRLPPGEIIKLTYPGSSKTVLITATERGPRGHFLSTQDNELLCCYELNESSLTFRMVLKLFHKKENRCQYKLLPGFLKFLFGLNAFKTLNIRKISNLQILKVETKK